MNFNKPKLFVLLFVFSSFAFSGCYEKEQTPLAEVVNDNQHVVDTTQQDMVSLAEQYPEVFPEMMGVDTTMANNIKVHAQRLLSTIGFGLDDVHLGIYLGEDAYVCFHNGKDAKFVFVLGRLDLLNWEVAKNIIPSISYTTQGMGPGGMSILVMPKYDSPLLSEIKFIHEYCHIGQADADFERIEGEYDAVYESYTYCKQHYPQIIQTLQKQTEYTGEFSKNTYIACEQLAQKNTVNKLEQWFLMQEYMSFVAIQHLESQSRLNPLTFAEAFYQAQACIGNMQRKEEKTVKNVSL